MKSVEELTQQPMEGAKRDRVPWRYDLLDPEFLHFMAEIAAYGAEHHGRDNWRLARLDGDASPVNHMYKHLGDYCTGACYDHLNGDTRYHLAAIAFNAMMEFYCATRDRERPQTGLKEKRS